MPLPEQKNIARLSNRRLISVIGQDAESFLQNVMTNDIRLLERDGLVYSLLLTPQGQFLHDFFVSRQPALDNAYLVDIDETRVEDFLKRLMMFKLRAQVTLKVLDADVLFVYAVTGAQGLQDPRGTALARRFYTTDVLDCDHDLDAYAHDVLMQGVPDSLAFMQQKDFPADLNLDYLHAIAWDKGCFIGQEVVARMHYRGLAKKRLMRVTAQGLAYGDMLFLNGRVIGEVRQVSAVVPEEGLAILRLEVLEPEKPSVLTAGGRPVQAFLPVYLGISGT